VTLIRHASPAPLLLAAALAAAGAHAETLSQTGERRDDLETSCLLVEAAARGNGLPVEFLARLIWQESNFRPDAIGPQTRSGARAQGIAQFMPGTAEERALLDPLNPVQALPKAAEFLRELRDRFGNLGLAAAAYNAGPRRVRDWLDGRGSLPEETHRYVTAITGRSPDDWAEQRGNDGSRAAAPASEPTDCGSVVASLRRTPGGFVDSLQRHVGASLTKPWGVQLSGGFSRERAISAYAKVERSQRDVLAGFDMIVLHGRIRSRGTRPFYQIRVGTDSRAAANSLCGRLHEAGVPCVVLRNKT
jgi:hypothetical protein